MVVREAWYCAHLLSSMERRLLRVCRICKSRKKRCDKALPRYTPCVEYVHACLPFFCVLPYKFDNQHTSSALLLRA